MMDHDALALDLAAALRTDQRMTWCDMQLGSSGSVRPDVYAIFKSYVRPQPTAYEVKVSRSDFRADVTAGKWQSYLKYANAVYFACEGDLIKATELPEHCGLIVRGPAVWRIRKRAVMSPVVIPQDCLLKLLIDGVQREGPSIRLNRYGQHHKAIEQANKLFGQDVADCLRDLQAVRRKIEAAQFTADRIETDARQRAEVLLKDTTAKLDPLRAALCELLELPVDSQAWHIKAAINQLRDNISHHPAIAQLEHIRASLDSMLRRTDKAILDSKLVPVDEVEA